MSRYAEDTSVSTDRSRAEIERTVRRYGASSFAYGWDDDRAQIEFVRERLRVRLVVPMPDAKSAEFTRTPTGKTRSVAQAEAAWEQACRQRWRALALVVKAKLEAVDAGITTFEAEFLAHLVLPTGETIGARFADDVAELGAGGAPSLLALPKGRP